MSRNRVTVIDIARAAGVSKSTVSLVLQSSPLVKEETRARVSEAIRDLGYVYNRGAAHLRQAKSKIIGIVVNDLTNSFFAELAVGMDMIVQSAGYVQFLAHAGEDVERQRELINSMREHGIAGLILSPARGTSAADLKPLADSGLPVVVVVRNVAGTRVSSLLSDNGAGARDAVRHLVGLGHRRIAFAGGFPDTQVFAERVAGYRDGLAEAGIAVDEALVIGSAPSRAGGAAAVERMLAGDGDAPTAALCFNDAVAFGVCDGLRARRLEPGVDFSVVGFDDVIEARTAVPALTTVAVDPQRMGQRAAQLLFKQINAGTAEPETIRTPVRLVVRQSTAAPARSRELS
ncbi:LacI family DNA-binding transcriptional regulator [Devosia sp.]|uniref:LacI family DNA-binding transcriptional regulator n=1 Tax=Devosia sp. TaxID=1871048 RepID=UPI002EED270D